MYVDMFISRQTLMYGVGQFLALIIVYNNHKNIQMLHIHLMVVCKNCGGHRHNESTLDLSTVPSLHYHKVKFIVISCLVLV
jgi:hypothetical protein